MWKSFYNPDLGKVETPQGTMTLPKIFLPLFLEMFLMNLMSTVNTFTLSFYSDEAVVAVTLNLFPFFDISRPLAEVIVKY